MQTSEKRDFLKAIGKSDLWKKRIDRYHDLEVELMYNKLATKGNIKG